ncbi:E3 ubiquitin-protein ligase TRIM21-like [Sinocyclocheilus anshuiensis]|uniref:E3 ubiquitin-protein ligase TRIM21-like n=1 Tax=Sinocyclocheilus anshuiensis TaxID=1608454 RepID=A0A671NLC6_9TELE|nr:PREDICTED: E3 ubiquitin-protein ligase TRIM21-like [Sinocyclocheilus anshuiensis]
MASSSGPLNEELQCSICLDVFNNPVTTPCGHNFCRTCLNKCWKTNPGCFCPICNEKFSKRPHLKINITLREVVQHFKEKLELGRSEVFCDICDERKQKALKSCLMCQSSYCETHLKPHHRVPRLKKHTLIDAVENLEHYICQKHERPLELFCRDDQTCVCLSCTEGDHRNHSTVPIEEESQEKKNQIVKTQTCLQQMIQDRMKKIQEIQLSVELRKKEKSTSVELFTDLSHSFEKCQSELLEKMEKQQKSTEKQAKDLIKELQQDISELKRRHTELEQLSQTEDDLHLLQIYSSICTSIRTKNWTQISTDFNTNVCTLNKALIQLKELEIIHKNLGQTVLKMMQQYAVDVTLDPDTAYPELILSKDGKQVRHGNIKQNLPNYPKRFESCLDILGKEAFSSGKFYFEVQVKGKAEWDLGVARESINRKGKVRLSPEDGCLTLVLRNENQYKACENPCVSLSQRETLEKVGVFVDYEEGLVSFYDVESSSHIYSFTGQSFTNKLYPFLSPCYNDEGKNSSPLIISPVISNK